MGLPLILGPFREPDVHDQAYADPNQGFHPQQSLPHSCAREAKRPACRLEKSEAGSTAVYLESDCKVAFYSPPEPACKTRNNACHSHSE